MSRKAVILLAEDEETDVYFVKWAFNQTGLPHQLISVTDGQEAVDYLSGDPPFSDRQQFPLPDLLLLDLKMPRLTGFDVLSWLRARSELSGITAVVLTSSQHPQDVERARELGAADYHVKPHSPSELVEIVRELDIRWIQKQPHNV